MAAITGADSIVIIKQGSTYGTAVQGASGDRIVLEDFSPSRTVTEGQSNEIGSGISWRKNTDILGFEDSVSFSQQARYDDAGLFRILAGFFGASAAPVEQTATEGDYLHRITHSGTANKFFTIAAKDTSGTAVEFPSCYPVSLSLQSGNTPGYLTYSVNFLANKRENSPTVNSATNLASSTVGGNTKIIHNSQALDNESENYFWLNAQGGDALDSGDAICPDTITITYDKPREIVRCFGGSEIRRTDIAVGTLVLTFPSHVDHTYLDAAKAGTVFKGCWNLQGGQINDGDDYQATFFFPELIVVEDPMPAITSAGHNTSTVTFRILAADSAPTGMNSANPYVDLVSTQSSALIS